jgi:hypothetical protein
MHVMYVCMSLSYSSCKLPAFIAGVVYDNECIHHFVVKHQESNCRHAPDPEGLYMHSILWEPELAVPGGSYCCKGLTLSVMTESSSCGSRCVPHGKGISVRNFQHSAAMDTKLNRTCSLST